MFCRHNFVTSGGLSSLLFGAGGAVRAPVVAGGGLFNEWTRDASKKASGGGNKNKKGAKGNRHGIWVWEGHRVYPEDIIVNMMNPAKLWFHPGLNVRLTYNVHNLVARKEGTVYYSCETPNLNWNEPRVQRYYSSRKKEVFFKKYVNVIPDPQHTRFRCIDSV